MPGKWPDQTLDQAFGLPEVLVAVSTSRLSCKRAGKTRTLMPVWDSSGESRIIPKLADPDSPCVNSSGTSIAKTYGGPMTYGQSARAPTLAKMSQAFRSLVLHADAPPQATQEGEMIESLAQMPTDTMIFLTMAVLGLAVMLIVLSRLI